MKIYTLIISIVLIGLNSYCQKFEPSTQFAVTATRSLITEEILNQAPDQRPEIDCFIYKVEDPTQVLIKVIPEEYEVFDSVQVYVLKNPGLKNVNEVLRVEVEYSACCFWADISYYLILDSGELLKLPGLHQSFCDWPADIDEYYFPSQHAEADSVIQHNMVSINYDGDIDKIETKSVLLWSGKQFSIPE